MTSPRYPVILVLLIIVILLAAGWLVTSINIGKPTPSTLPVTSIRSIPSTPIPSSGYWIKIDPVGDKQVGENITIRAITNLSYGEDVIIQVYQGSWHPGCRFGCSWSGAAGQVKVSPGMNGTNFTAINISLSEFNPDVYLISEFALNQSATTESKFNVSLGKEH